MVMAFTSCGNKTAENAEVVDSVATDSAMDAESLVSVLGEKLNANDPAALAALSQQAQQTIADLKATVEALKASIEKPSIPEPKAGQKAQANPNLDAPSDKAERIKQINASSMSAMEKLRAIARLNIKKEG